MKRMLITTGVLLAVLCLTDCKLNKGRLSKKVDILFDSMHEVRQDVRNLQDSVDAILQMLNSSDEGLTKDLTSNTAHQITESQTVETLTSPSEHLEMKMMTVIEGFRKEKSNIRNTLRDNFMFMFDNVTSRINTIAMTTTANVSALQDTIAMTTIDTKRVLQDNITSRIDGIETTMMDNISVLQDSVASSNSIMTGKIETLSKQFSDMEATTVEQIKELKTFIDNLKERKLKPITLKEAGYTQHGNSFYKFISDSVITWQAAQRKCKAADSHLVEINSRSEHDFIKHMVNGKWLWLGGTDMDHEGTFTWSTSGLPVYEWLWRSREPNNANGNEDCVNMNTDGEANDIYCSARFRYMCEIEL